MSWLLKLYPPAWRRRYEHELADHLRTEPTSLRTAVDLLAGAADAWFNPDSIPDVPDPPKQGARTMIHACRRESLDIPPAEARRSAGLMIGISLVLTTIAVVLDKRYGDHIAIEALLYSTFFIALTLSSRRTYLKPYSGAARTTLVIAGVAGWYGFFLAVAAIGTLI